MINESIKKEVVKDIRWALINKSQAMQKFSEVKEYNCENYGISSLKGIEKLLNLQKFNAYNNSISSLTELESLTSLKILNIDSNTFFKNEGLSVISKLTNLEELHIANNNIDTLEGLENLTNLKILNVSHNHIKDLTSIVNLPNIERLFINVNQIESLAGVGNFQKLKLLTCHTNPFMTTNNPFKNLSSVDIANIVRNNPLYSSIKLNKFMKIGMFDHLTTFTNYQLSLNERKKIESVKEWKDRLFKEYPKGEILKDDNYHYFFKSENDATKCFTSNTLNSTKAKDICIEKMKQYQ
jgi:hypothetical protein